MENEGNPKMPGEKNPQIPGWCGSGPDWQRSAVPWGRMGKDALSGVMGWGPDPALSRSALLSPALGLQKSAVREFKGLKLSLFYAESLGEVLHQLLLGEQQTPLSYSFPSSLGFRGWAASWGSDLADGLSIKTQLLINF